MNSNDRIPPEIAVVIRTRNSGQTLQSCLDSLYGQEGVKLDVVIVDSGSEDYTLEIAEEYSCRIIRYPRAEEFNYSRAINIGIKETEAEFVVVLSSHCSFSQNNALALMYYYMKNHPLAAGTSLNVSRELISGQVDIDTVKWSVINRMRYQGFGLTNSISMIRRELWEQYPFNESLPRCEDQDWAYHFIFSQNQYTLSLVNVMVNSRNPYDSIQKNVYDRIFISRHYYPHWRTIRGILGFVKKSIKCLIQKRKYGLAKLYWLTALGLLGDRISQKEIPGGTLNHTTKAPALY